MLNGRWIGKHEMQKYYVVTPTATEQVGAINFLPTQARQPLALCCRCTGNISCPTAWCQLKVLRDNPTCFLVVCHQNAHIITTLIVTDGAVIYLYPDLRIR